MRSFRTARFPFATKLIAGCSALAASALAMVAAPSVAHADDPDPIAGYTCSASQNGLIAWAAPTYTVTPTLTQFSALEITPGTTGSHSVSLSTVNTVTRTVTDSTGVSVTASSAAGLIFVKVGLSVTASYSLSVVSTGTTTTTDTETLTENFNAPGRYGLYRGTYTITGDDQTLQCNRVSDLPPRPGDLYMWGSVHGRMIPGRGYTDGSLHYHFTMFTSLDEGTVSCGNTPIGAVAKLALTVLGC
ncbi:MAG: hypothetical protein M3Y42_10990 [Actinomycetota bacterium]|nr:hypothetical protein [Actinomycetota bacterium]MDQ2957479.1 hypothetical protein [Actinomycetota bacterium]